MSANEDTKPDWLTVGKSFKRPPSEKREKGSPSSLTFLPVGNGSDGDSESISRTSKKQKPNRRRRHNHKSDKKKKKKKMKQTRRLEEGEFTYHIGDNLDSDSEDERALAKNRRTNALKQQIGKERIRRRDGETSLGHTKLWSIDARPDRSTLMYGKLYNREVPLYHGELSYHGSGRRRKWRDSENEYGLRGRYYGPAARKIMATSTEMEQLWLNKKRRRNLKDNTITSSVEEVTSPIFELPYVPLPLATLPYGSGQLNDESDVDFVTETVEQSMMRKTKEFNEETRNNPTNVLSWLSYAKFLSQSPAYRDKRLDVLRSGVRKNPGSVVLWLAFLQETAAIEPNEQVVDRLFKKGLLKCGQASAPLWRAYISYKRSRFSTFDMVDIRDLCAASAEALSTIGTDMKAEIVRIGNVLQTCAIEKSSGYAERSVGMLQCLVELCFVDDAQKALEMVEEFWEDEAPRIGDEGPASAGLCKWLERKREKLLKRKGEGGGGSTSVADVVNKGGMKKHDDNVVGCRSRAADFFADIDSEEEDLDPTANSLIKEQLEPLQRSSAARHLHDAYQAALEATAAAAEREELIAASEQAYLEERNLDDVEQNGKGSGEEDDKQQMKDRDSDVIHEDKTGQQEEVEDVDDGLDKRRIALETAIQTEGLIWINEKDGTAYSVPHGRRISIFEPSVDLTTTQAHLHRSILEKVKGETGRAEDGESSRTTDALSRRLRRWAARKDVEKKREAVVLCPIAKDDQYVVWVGEEDVQATQQWQPLRSITDPDAAEAQPDRVVFWGDIKPYMFLIQTPSGQAMIIASLLREAGLHLPLCFASHSPFYLVESEMTYGFSDSFACSILGGGMPGFEIPQSTVTCAFVACDQPVWLSKELLCSKMRQAFARNTLYTLIANLSHKDTDPGLLLHLQCTLLAYEGLLLGSKKGETNIEAVTDDATADRVARSLLQASEGSKTDLRIWAAYVRMLEARRKRKEALRVACVALNTTLPAPAPLEPQYEKHAPCLFWLAFRLKMGLALSSISAISLPEKMKITTRNAVLELLVSMAEGTFTQTTMTKVTSRKEGGGGSSSSNYHHLQIPPTRLLSARRNFVERIGRALKEIIASDDVAVDIHLDSTPPLYYYAAAYSWFQLLTLGVNAATESMNSVLKSLAISSSLSTSNDDWEVQPDYGVRSVCLSRCHRELCELLKCAIAWNMYGSPLAIRKAVEAGLGHFPCDPALLLCFAETEMYSSHNHVVSGYISKTQLSIRRQDWTAGPSAQEWVFFLSVELTRCASQSSKALGLAAGGECENSERRLCWDISLWTRGSMARLRRFFEKALGDPTGHGLAFLWCAYILTEVCAGCHSRAKRLYLRAVHACPGCKELWLDGARTGLLREALRSDELHDFVSASVEKGIFWRAPVPIEIID